MVEAISEFFAKVFNDNVVLATILISMLPVIELRGAIPFGTNSSIWGNIALNQWSSFAWSLIGSSAIVPVLALIIIPIISWLKKTKLFGKFAKAFENRVTSKANNLVKSSKETPNITSYWKKFLAVFIFVAIPLPLTGVWTGTCVAIILGLDYLSTCISVIGGNVVAGLLITLILEFFPWLNSWLLWIFLVLVLIFALYEIVRYFVRKNKGA